MITTGISSQVRYSSEDKGVRLLSFGLLSSKDLKTSIRWTVFFSTSVANETENLNIWFKLNQWAKIP